MSKLQALLQRLEKRKSQDFEGEAHLLNEELGVLMQIILKQNNALEKYANGMSVRHEQCSKAALKSQSEIEKLLEARMLNE